MSLTIFFFLDLRKSTKYCWILNFLRFEGSMLKSECKIQQFFLLILALILKKYYFEFWAFLMSSKFCLKNCQLKKLNRIFWTALISFYDNFGWNIFYQTNLANLHRDSHVLLKKRYRKKITFCAVKNLYYL